MKNAGKVFSNRYIHILLFLCLALPGMIEAKNLSIERIYSSPSLNGQTIRGLKISPDGSRVTFLKGKQSDYERLDLWEYHIASGKTRLLFDSNDLQAGKENLSEEEKGRRERMRLKGSGIVSYQWSDNGKALLFPLAGDVYLFKIGDSKARKILDTPEFETDVRFSPKATHISFIREKNLFTLNIKSGEETQLTFDGKDNIKNGMAEFVAQEEMGRMTGYWWSKDESKIAFTRIDESPVEIVTRADIYANNIKLVKQRYPFAGKANVKINLAVIALDSKKIKWIDLGKNDDIYLPRVQWTNNSSKLSYQLQSRDQKELSLKSFDWNSQNSQNLLKESSDTWVNLNDDLRYLKNGNMIWASEKDGFKHLYLYNSNGALIRQLTHGDWVVDKIENVDENTDLIYFTGRKDTPLERHLYSVSMKTAKISKLSYRNGYHSIKFSKDGQIYVDNFSSVDTPPQVSLHNNTGRRLAWLSENKINQNHPLFEYKKDLIKPEFGSFESKDDARLYYRLYKPSNFDPQKKYPAMVYLYGGPHAQMVTNRWGNFFLQYMAQQGYAVFTMDNRGSNYRGKKFEEGLYRAMGSLEVDDQIEGVKFLRSLTWVDENKIGVHGHSYGGYMTLMTMFKAGDYFKAGVAGAPVTDWTLYDTHYTERYMGNPKKDSKAYNDSSVFPYATQLKGPLLIYHGMADDNVLFKNSTRLYKLLQDNNIQFSSMDYPGKKHSLRGKKTQMHRANLIRSFFDLHFGVKR